MNYIVLLKQVPDTTSIPAEAWDQEKGTLKRGMLDNVLNPHDLHALTFACYLRKTLASEGKVVCLTMGIPTAFDVLLDAMARGADEGVLLTDAVFAGADTAATARSIELAIRKIQRDLFAENPQYIVVAGMQSVDGDTAQVPPQIAEAMGIDMMAYVTKLESGGPEPVFQRIGPQGLETVRPTSYPVLMTLTECTKPLYPSLVRAREVRARPHPYLVWRAADIGANPQEVGAKGSRTQVVRLFSPKQAQKDCLFVNEVSQLLPAIEDKLRAVSKDSRGGKIAYQPHGPASHTGEIWVYAESHGGRLAPAAGELVGKARELADVLDQKVGAVLVGHEVRAMADKVIACGADTAYVADDPRLARYNSVTFGGVLSHFVLKHKPQIMLFSATPLGRELAPRVAYATGSGLTADCTQLDIGDHAGETAVLLQTRPALGGNIMATIISKKSLKQMATVRPGVFASPPDDASRKGSFVEYDGPITAGTVEILSLASAPERKTLAGAEIIVSGGAGMRKAEAFRQMLGQVAEGLGRRLGMTSRVGASRRAVERSLAIRDQQVGQTGQTVEPALYMAVGISGAVQHISGMQKSKVIVAINSDTKAPIFRYADIGMVGKAEKILPGLLEELGRPTVPQDKTTTTTKRP